VEILCAFALNSGFMILWGRALADNLITCAFSSFSSFSCQGASRDVAREERGGPRGMGQRLRVGLRWNWWN
jgi:hypothetical protein